MHTIVIRLVANGWIVEVWRAGAKKEEHVFAEAEAMLTFVTQTTSECG